MTNKEGNHKNAVNFLVFQAKRGDKAALQELYKLFFLPMKRYAAIKTSSATVAEDVVQNVWLKISKRIAKLENDSLFQSWLFRALRWEISDWAKSFHEKNFETSDQAGLEEASNHLDITVVFSAIRGLPDTEGEVVVLHYVNGLSVAETALVLSIPEGTVKSRLSRARELLRKSMNESI
ncbi:hypothetical protein CWE09_09335 [Aliidiomarina minuta]|uniref:RNA polymerase sigma factor 70 region 4 type 2 domain-containing protein n=1 Tax=Aliidiomarina minuta TaxID=880057 RepID=A0A432W9U3_9GAMM|nr:RNA polymerase sigma factor [Aliidiomarina minuta]RUO26872.1 hypothetical protein CWE09_09335 [Aliidiomarina minuta]